MADKVSGVEPKIKVEFDDGEVEEDRYRLDTLQNLNPPPEPKMSLYSPHRPPSMRKGDKVCFVCKLCKIPDLNSLEMKLSHENGKQHRANRRKYVETHGDYCVPGIEAIAAPKTLGQTHVRLAEKLREARDLLIVGLEYVTEIIPCSSEEEPHYECNLCGTQGIGNPMFNHLSGKSHKQKVLRKKEPNNPAISDMSPRELTSKLEKYRNEDYSVINTVYSDYKYPWDAGKAPWSIERGGTGQPPTDRDDVTFARPKFGNETSTDSKYGILANQGPLSLPDFPEDLKLRTNEDLDMAYQWALKLLDLASSNQTHPDNQNFELIVSNARIALMTLRNFKHKNEKGISVEEERFPYDGRQPWSGKRRRYDDPYDERGRADRNERRERDDRGWRR